MLRLFKKVLLLLFVLIIPFNNLKSNNPEINDSTNITKEIQIISDYLGTIKTNIDFEGDSILNLTKKTLRLSKQNNFTFGINSSYKYLGDIYKYRHSIDSAIFYYELGTRNAKENNNLLADFYWSLSNLYRLTGDYSKSLESSLNLKELIEHNKTRKYYYSVYNLLALSYQNLMEYNLARENFEKSAKFALLDSNEAYAGVIYSNIGKLFFDQEKLDSALAYFAKGVKIEEKYKLYQNVGNSYTVIAQIYLEKEILDTARLYLVKGLKNLRKSKSKIGITNNLMIVSKYYFLINDIESAEFHLKKTIDYATELSSRSTLSKAYKLSAEINAKKKNYKKAYSDFEKFFEIHNVLYDVQKINEAKAIEQKLIQQEKENELVALQLEKQKTITILLIVIVALAFLVVLIILIYLIKFKKINKELVESKNKAEESDKLKSKFLQTISHEIRTPLNGIIGFSEMILSNQLKKSELIQINDHIHKNSNDLISTIDNLVDIAHLTTNQYNIRKSKFKLTPILDEVVKEAKLNLTFKHKNELNIICHINEEIILHTDKTIILKILIHLVKNAILYTEKGSVSIGYKIQMKNIVISVKDTGIGIPKEKIDIIFSPFRQADENINIKVGGTGLGLTIVSKLIQLLHGKISVDSEPNKGSTFYISLPL
jgi:signal transduction histidine kinase/Tfp pilus assembly protein PilF